MEVNIVLKCKGHNFSPVNYQVKTISKQRIEGLFVNLYEIKSEFCNLKNFSLPISGRCFHFIPPENTRKP